MEVENGVLKSICKHFYINLLKLKGIIDFISIGNMIRQTQTQTLTTLKDIPHHKHTQW